MPLSFVLSVIFCQACTHIAIRHSLFFVALFVLLVTDVVGERTLKSSRLHRFKSRILMKFETIILPVNTKYASIDGVGFFDKICIGT